MNTVIFKKIDQMFWDSEFQNTEYEKFATVVFLLAIARQSWIFPKFLIENWNSAYAKKFIKRGWLKEKDDSYEMTLVFQGHGENEIEIAMQRDKIVAVPLNDNEETFEVGKYTVKVSEVQIFMKAYLQKEKEKSKKKKRKVA